jgi:hypothetical protein
MPTSQHCGERVRGQALQVSCRAGVIRGDNMIGIDTLKTAAVGALVAGSFGFGGGYKVADWRLTSAHTAEAFKASQRAASELAEATSERDALSSKLSAANDENLRRLQNAQSQTNDLRARLADGTASLRIAAKCPGVPATTESASGSRVDTGTSAELDTDARRAYFSLRDGINRAEAKLSACQSELRLRSGQ